MLPEHSYEYLPTAITLPNANQSFTWYAGVVQYTTPNDYQPIAATVPVTASDIQNGNHGYSASSSTNQTITMPAVSSGNQGSGSTFSCCFTYIAIPTSATLAGITGQPQGINYQTDAELRTAAVASLASSWHTETAWTVDVGGTDYKIYVRSSGWPNSRTNSRDGETFRAYFAP